MNKTLRGLMMRNFWKTGVIALTLLLTLLTLLTGAALLHADPGDLDLTFGNGAGYVTTNIDHFDITYSIALESSGRIISVGTSFDTSISKFTASMVRYLPDGALDTTFGNNGVVLITTYPDNPDISQFADLVIQPDGKILVTGILAYQAFMVRFNSDGTPDLSFGTQGQVIAPSWDEFTALSVDTAGNITVIAHDNNGTDFSALLKYTPGGNLDTTFGNQGVSTALPFQATLSLLPDTDNGFLLVGKQDSTDSKSDIVLARYTATGIPDPDFGNNGMVITDLDEIDSAARAVRDTSGRIVVTGFTGKVIDGVWVTDLVVLRYLSNGTLDTTFGNNGFVITEALDGTEGIAVLLDDLERIIAIGEATEKLPEPGAYIFSMLLTRYTPDGIVDTTFGNNGIVLFRPQPEKLALAIDAALDETGKIVVGGYMGEVNGELDLLLARFQTDFSPTATPTITDTPDTANLIINGGFEVKGNPPQGWTLKRATKDKVKCDQTGKPPVAYEGDCAFRFKGSAGENSQLFQKPDLTGLTFASGDEFTFQTQIHARGQIAFKALASLTYGDGSQHKIKFDLTPADAASDYVLYSDSYTLTGSNLSKIKVLFKNKSASGKIDVDDVRLTITSVASQLQSLP